MVKSLGFESIAEGVEEEQQYKYLRVIGVISFRDICSESRCHRKRSNSCCRRCTDLLGQKEEAAMLTGREQETAFLENHYKRQGVRSWWCMDREALARRLS